MVGDGKACLGSSAKAFKRARIAMASSLPPFSAALLVWSFGATLYLVGFFQRVAPAVITTELMGEFGLTAAALGNLSALYFYTYVAMQIPTGVLVDHFGPRRVLTAGATLACLATLLFSLSSSFGLVATGRLAIGASVAVAFVSMLKLAAHWASPSRFAMLSGLALACGVIGGVTAGVPLRLAVDAFGWRNVMIGVGIATGVLAVFTWWVVRDDPRERGYSGFTEGDPHSRPVHTMLGGIREVLRYPNVWFSFVACGAITGPVLAFGGLWGVPFLVTHYGMSTANAAFVTSVLLVAWAVGGPIAGALSDRLQRRKAPIAVGGIVATILWCVVIWVPGLPYPVLLAVLALIGFSSAVIIIGFAFAKESAPSTLAGTASGIANMGNMLGGMVMQPVIGEILDASWSGSVDQGVRIYEHSAYQAGFGFMVMWLAIGTIAVFFSQETRCRQIA